MKGAAVSFLLKEDAFGSQIRTFGDALWRSATIVTTVASELYRVTLGGQPSKSLLRWASLRGSLLFGARTGACGIEVSLGLFNSVVVLIRGTFNHLDVGFVRGAN